MQANIFLSCGMPVTVIFSSVWSAVQDSLKAFGEVSFALLRWEIISRRISVGRCGVKVLMGRLLPPGRCWCLLDIAL